MRLFYTVTLYGQYMRSVMRFLYTVTLYGHFMCSLYMLTLYGDSYSHSIRSLVGSLYTVPLCGHSIRSMIFRRRGLHAHAHNTYIHCPTVVLSQIVMVIFYTPSPVSINGLRPRDPLPVHWMRSREIVLSPPPPLYKLRPCPSYSRRRDCNNCVHNFNCVRNVVWPHETWVCRHICQLHGAMDRCNMPHATQFDFQEFEVARAQTSP